MTNRTASQAIECKILEEAALPAWDAFVDRHPQASVYHLSVWRHILYKAFRKRWYLVAVLRDGEICAGLPLVHMQSKLFGNSLISIPFVNYGGLLTEDDAWAEPILQGAVELGRTLGARHLELRHLENHYPRLPVYADKVSMWLPLPATTQELLTSFKSKLRSQIRKGEKNGLGVRIGRTELLDDFYTIFASNMRALGTPAYPRVLFQDILKAFAESAQIVVVTGAGQRPLAGGFLLGYRDRLEIPSASSLRQYNHLQSNMWLYWNCLKYACEHGYRTFDFGRSTEGSPTFKFKAQWGAQPVRHHWHYHLKAGRTMPKPTSQKPTFRLATHIWRRLPSSMTYVLGPAIVKHLP